MHINVRLQLHIVIIVIYFENILQIFHKKPEGPNRDKWSSYYSYHNTWELHVLAHAFTPL